MFNCEESMNDLEFYRLIRQAMDTGREHIAKHWQRVERPCIERVMDRIEDELHARELEALLGPAYPIAHGGRVLTAAESK